MTNKTPQDWAIKAAVDIVNTVDANPAYNFSAKNVTASNMARIIGERAPDAEALAVALESLIAHAIEHHVISPVDESVAVIAAYRARFPNVKVEP